MANFPRGVQYEENDKEHLAWEDLGAEFKSDMGVSLSLTPSATSL